MVSQSLLTKIHLTKNPYQKVIHLIGVQVNDSPDESEGRLCCVLVSMPMRCCGADRPCHWFHDLPSHPCAHPLTCCTFRGKMWTGFLTSALRIHVQTEQMKHLSPRSLFTSRARLPNSAN